MVAHKGQANQKSSRRQQSPNLKALGLAGVADIVQVDKGCLENCNREFHNCGGGEEEVEEGCFSDVAQIISVCAKMCHFGHDQSQEDFEALTSGP